MKENTFGSSEAANVLQNMLENDGKSRRKVSRILSSYSNSLTDLTYLPSIKSFRLHLLLLKRHIFEQIDTGPVLSDEIKRFIKNVITARHREAFEYSEHMRFLQNKNKNQKE